MKASTILLLGVGGLLAYNFAQLGVAGATVQFVMQTPSFISLTQLSVPVLVQNVSNASVNLNAMSGTVSINGNSLGNVSYFPSTPTVIQPTSQQIVNFQASISLFNLPSTIQNLINNVPGSGTYTFTISGNANINSLIIPFTLSYPVTI
jgi:Late embryogenesis abundant protein